MNVDIGALDVLNTVGLAHAQRVIVNRWDQLTCLHFVRLVPTSTSRSSHSCWKSDRRSLPVEMYVAAKWVMMSSTAASCCFLAASVFLCFFGILAKVVDVVVLEGGQNRSLREYMCGWNGLASRGKDEM